MKNRRFGPMAGAVLLLAAPALAQTTPPPAEQSSDRPANPESGARPGDPTLLPADAQPGPPDPARDPLPQQPVPPNGSAGDATQPEQPREQS
jgi:hypothetical protein